MYVKRTKYWVFVVFALLALLPWSAMNGCANLGTKPDGGKIKIEFLDTNGVSKSGREFIETGDSLSVGLSGLPPGSQVQLRLSDDRGREWSYARVFADRKGRVEPALFWYHTGVIGTTSRKTRFRPDPAFTTFEEAEAYFNEHPLMLTLTDGKGRAIFQKKVPIRKRSTPMIYPSNSKGVLVNSFESGRDDVYVTGRNFKPGAVVNLFVLKNRHVWAVGTPLADVSGKGRAQEVEKIRLAPKQTSFTVKVWERSVQMVGAYDLVAKMGDLSVKPVLANGDILSYAEDTGIILFDIIDGHVVIDSAGRMLSSPAYFEYSDSFEKNQDVYAAVDPTDVPEDHPGGNYAAYYVVDHKPADYWNGVNPVLADVTGGVEIWRVKYWCINVPRARIWQNATQAEAAKAYDVVVDFGAVPAIDAASFVQDDVYHKGVDFIDGLNKEGFWLFEDPSTAGTIPVGQVVLDDPNGISGITDPTGASGPTQNVTLAWARIMYPAEAAGTGTPVKDEGAPHPVALFLHGRHWNCDYDGSGPGLNGGYSFSCDAANRIPSHEGYNYIMERLASQGIIAISISAHEIQPGLGSWDYNARGRLILKYLDKLWDWNENGTDPFGGIFEGKIDMSRIALSGHSRGGEGVVAAQQLNLTWPRRYSIVAVNAIAPTDQNGTAYQMTDADYFLLIGARDDDVGNMQGYRTYDRAFPDGMADRHSKSVAWIYGANHNYFNKVWTHEAALGEPNPWAGCKDDAANVVTPQAMSAADQRQIALVTVTAFFRWQLLDVYGYREIFTGRLKPSSIQNQYVYFTYQDPVRKAVDNFEQQPSDPDHNTLTGDTTDSGFTAFEERLLNHDGTEYTAPPLPPSDSRFFHDTLGMNLSWAAPQTYATALPPGSRDVSMYSYLTIRAAKCVTGPAAPGAAVNLYVNIEDGLGKKGYADAWSSQFDAIPHPYQRSGGNYGYSNQALLKGVRIPLRYFTMNNSKVNLSDIVRITVRTEGAGEIGIDDIEFGN